MVETCPRFICHSHNRPGDFPRHSDSETWIPFPSLHSHAPAHPAGRRRAGNTCLSIKLSSEDNTLCFPSPVTEHFSICLTAWGRARAVQVSVPRPKELIWTFLDTRCKPGCSDNIDSVVQARTHQGPAGRHRPESCLRSTQTGALTKLQPRPSSSSSPQESWRR